jgi:hypothetical protein
MEVYAYRARDAPLIAQATVIRQRGERRLGELMAAEAKDGKLAKGTKGQGRWKKIGGVTKTPPKSKPSAQPTLADRGIDKNLANRARAAAAMPAEQFEKAVAKKVTI